MYRIPTAALAVAALVAIGATAACGSEPAAAPSSTSGTASEPDMTSTASSTTTYTIVDRPDDVQDEMVLVGGARMRLHCEGSGSTTVLLVAGFTSAGDDWGPLETSMAAQARVCDYARFGNGASDPAPRVQTFATQADDLRAMLDTAGEPGPYVLVGHSFGGPVAVTFADRTTEDVVGLLLVDASPAGWYDAVCAASDDGTDPANNLGELCASLTDPAANPERLDGETAFAGVGAITSLGDLPMVVITAARRSSAGIPASELGHLTQLWNDGESDYADLSTSSQLVPVDGVGHYIHLDRPDLVTGLLEDLVP